MSEKELLEKIEKLEKRVAELEKDVAYMKEDMYEFVEDDSYTEEDGKKHSTLLYDIVLDNEVPEDYYIDFEIQNNLQ